eukprot:8516495-Lingulodinium_polyedra.AAC.1
MQPAAQRSWRRWARRPSATRPARPCERAFAPLRAQLCGGRSVRPPCATTWSGGTAEMDGWMCVRNHMERWHR